MDPGIVRDPMAVPYTFITTTDGALECLLECAGADLVAMDTETEVLPDSDLDRDGPGPWSVLSVAARFGAVGEHTEKVWVIDMTHIDCSKLESAMSVLEPYAWNASFERRVFHRAGLRVARWWDPMLFDAVLRQGKAADGKPFYKGLAAVADARLGAKLGGKGGIQLSFKPGVELTDEQKAYAAQDAVVVLWLEPLLSADLDAAGLREAAALECGALGVFQDMTLNGLWLDAPGWLAEVATHAVAVRDAEDRLAGLTTGGQGNLFDERIETAWKPGNPADVRRILNQFDEERVRAYTAKVDPQGGRRLLGPADSVDHDALTLIGGEIAQTLLKWAEHRKVVTTYGEDFVAQAHADGRFHARYLHGLTATGRSSSDRPNFQNLTPLLKKHLRPTAAPLPVTELDLETAAELGLESLRVFVAVDLSQAELRKLTFESGDSVMFEAYSNKADLHTTTASRMFGRPLEEIEAAKESGEPWAAEMRAKGKTLNFGVVYGLSATSLGKNLTVAGVPTTTEEGAELLRLYDQAYPGIARYLAERDAVVDELAKNPPECDWDATWRLHAEFKKVKSVRFRLRDRTGSFPSSNAEIANEYEPLPALMRRLADELGRTPDEDEIAAAYAKVEAHVAWVRSFDAPVVLLAGGTTPLSFESRTSSGRRRLFEVSTDAWIDSMAQIAARTSKPRAAAVRDEWAAANNCPLTFTDAKGRVRPLSRDALKKRFDGAKGRALKESFVAFVIDAMGPQAAEYLMREAVSDNIRAAKRQYRNHPIQGGVADAVEAAFALIEERFGSIPSARVVQSVHDSVVAECDPRDVAEVSKVLVSSMEEGLARFCGEVPVVADVDVMASLDAKRHTVDAEELSRLCELADALDASRAATPVS